MTQVALAETQKRLAEAIDPAAVVAEVHVFVRRDGAIVVRTESHTADEVNAAQIWAVAGFLNAWALRAFNVAENEQARARARLQAMTPALNRADRRRLRQES
ncbi:MAG TPA: hypothetical protein VIV06_11900 [Candidatus Limnocylindrales bacterium]